LVVEMLVEEALVGQRMVGVDARKIEEKIVRWNEDFVRSYLARHLGKA